MSTLWLALLAPPAAGFAPPTDLHMGIEPHRVQHQHPEVQARYLRSEAWERFVATDGAGWRATFDEATGTPRVIWGRGIPVDTSSADTVAADVQAVLDRHATLLGFEQGALRLVSAKHVARTDTWYLQLDALRDGLPTYRGGLSARVKHGNLILVHVATAPDVPVTGDLVLTRGDAIQGAISEGPEPDAEHREASAEPVLLQRKTLGAHELRTAWMVRTRTADPPGIWVTFVDAQTGELLSVHNEVRFLTGEVTGQHHERTLDGSPLLTSPMPLIAVSGDSDADIADDSGVYDVATSGSYVAELSGDYLTVENANGGEGLLVSSSPDMTWTDDDATQAEIDSYVFLHQVKAWGEQVAPEVGMVWEPLTSWVNIGDVCNAYYDGNVNFFSAGGGCNNTGQIADVNYHEWGHGFHAWSLQAGFFDGSLSEGASDVVSFLQTGDNLMAPFFGTTGWAIRDVAPDQVYPQDYSSNVYEVHTNGLIFGGTMWDLWDLLKDAEGDTVGTRSTEEIFAGLLKGGTDIPGTFYEALVADDNDGNLDNGTPHTCELYEAFGIHGLGPAPGDTVIIANHEPVIAATPQRDIGVELELIEASQGCQGGQPRDGEVHYRVDGGAWESSPLSASGSDLAGVIPGQAEGTFVEYYLTGSDVTGEAFAAPAGMQINPYTVFVGDVIELHCTDFEADDGGFTHTLVAGQDQEGADDWQWGTPVGASGDPASAFSGSKVWGNDLGHDNFNGAYQPDKTNALTSPTLETAHYTGVFLQYRRWLQIEDGAYDRASITANGQTVWTNWGGTGEEHHLDGSWALHSVDLDGVADQGAVTLSWELASDAGLELGGWTIDDVCVLAPATPDNRLAIVDFSAEVLSDTHVGLSWTHPVHDPVQQVVVVRRTDRWPSGPEDGKVVYSDDAPEVGAEITFVDPAYDTGDNYYAAYGFDGTAWLSWTVEGWNAGTVDLVGGTPPVGAGADGAAGGKVTPEFDRMGCGCSTRSGLAASGWLGLGLVLLMVRRRR